MNKDTATSSAASAATAAPDYPGKSLEATIAAARMATPVIVAGDGEHHAFVPPGFQLIKLPDRRSVDPWPKQKVTVDDRQSLINYTNRFSSDRSVILADFDKATVTAELDWHPHNTLEDSGTSGTKAHSATLKLILSEEFARWDAMAGKLHPQADFARFLEENAVDILHPDAATMIEISRDFEATQSNVYKSSVRLDNGDRRLNFQTDSNASTGIVIPQKFSLSIPIYNGEQPDELTAMFRWKPSAASGVALGFEWHRVEYQRRAHFHAIAFAVAEATGLPVIMGRQA